MEFKALRIPALTEEVADNLTELLNELSGVEQFAVSLEKRELYVMFDENQLGFQTLVQEMARAGCSLHHIDAALLL